jgi:hypothetical protein
MKPDCGRIKLAQLRWITKVIKKEARLMWDAIERNGFDSQAGFFRRAETCGFDGAQCVMTP